MPTESRSSWWRSLCGLVIPVALLPVLFLWNTQEAKCAFAVLWLAGYWVTEAIPIEMTALMPIALFPVLGLLSTAETCLFYGKEIIFFFIGGMMIAVAMEESNLHKRIALKTLLLLGTGTKRMMLGFMLTCMFLSMWLSNTACVVMMSPVVDAILEERSRLCRLDSQRCNPQDAALDAAKKKELGFSKIWVDHEGDRDNDVLLRKVMLLSLAYSASCGATGTPNGGGPNIVFLSIFEQLYPQSTELTYISWMWYNVPGMLLCVLGGWCILVLFHRRAFGDVHVSETIKASVRDIVQTSYKALGPFSFREGAVLALLLLQVCLWIFREPQFIPGWATFFTEKDVRNATPSLAVPVLLFLIPSDPRRPGASPRLLDWSRFQHQMPWGLAILVGGGLAVAGGTRETGLSYAIGEQLSWLSAVPAGAAVCIVCIFGAMLTEILSNTAASTMIMPILSQLAEVLRVNPMYFMLPVSVCCSFAFMLPVATPPNAYVYDRGNMKMTDMMKPGILMNLLCVATELMMINTWGVYLFTLDKFPTWADFSSKGNVTNFVTQTSTVYTTSSLLTT